jgi:hypothetical protein
LISRLVAPGSLIRGRLNGASSDKRRIFYGNGNGSTLSGGATADTAVRSQRTRVEGTQLGAGDPGLRRKSKGTPFGSVVGRPIIIAITLIHRESKSFRPAGSLSSPRSDN